MKTNYPYLHKAIIGILQTVLAIHLIYNYNTYNLMLYGPVILALEAVKSEIRSKC
jgi:hypothetical protein